MDSPDRAFTETLYREHDQNHDSEETQDGQTRSKHQNSETLSCNPQNHPDQARKTAGFNGQGNETAPGHPDQAERIGGCAYCRDAVYLDDVVRTKGEALHHRCVDVWSTT